MTIATVVKTIGSTGKFSTVQLWEDGAPANLTTAEKSSAGTFLVAAFTQGESLTFVGSGATGKFLDTDSTGAGNGTYITYGITSGNPAASDVVTGGTSGATCVLSSGTPIDTGVIWQGECQNQEFVVAGIVVTVSGSTTSSSAHKELKTVAGASFRDNANAQTNPLRYDASVGCGLRATTNICVLVNPEDNFGISNLQLAATGSNAIGLFVNGTNFIARNLIVEGTRTQSGGGTLVLTGNTDATATLENIALILRTSAASAIISLGTLGTGNTYNFYNCTVVAPDDLAAAPTDIVNIASTVIGNFENCALFAGDSSKAITTGAGTANFTACYSDISGTTGVTQCTYANQFVDVNDATRDFRVKNRAADVVDTGTTDSTNAANDIVGTARPQYAAYDVGCWELRNPLKAFDPLNQANLKSLDGIAMASLKNFNGIT